MGPRVMTVAPSTAISWLSYEFFSMSTNSPHRITLTGCRGSYSSKWYHARNGTSCLESITNSSLDPTVEKRHRIGEAPHNSI
jgi:hypothetical protein